LAHQVPPSLDQLNTILDPQLLQRPAGPLHVEQFLDFTRSEFGSPVLVPLQPVDEVRERRPLVEQLERLLIRRGLPVHPWKQPLQREVTQFADSQPESLGALTDSGVPQTSLWATVQNLPDGVSVEFRDPSEVFLIPAPFLDQPRNLIRQFRSGTGH